MRSKKILFINFGGLGDEILFLPTIQSVKKEFPNSHITLVLEERSKGITSLTDSIDNILFANIKGKNKYQELARLLFKIWTKKFDIVISSGSNKFISIFLFLTFIKQK
jgi:ADP-heptose:LPS heptosyltransferase